MGPGFGLFAHKAVRELGLERRDSSVPICREAEDIGELSLVREDRDGRTSSVPVVLPGIVALCSEGEALKTGGSPPHQISHWGTR